MTEQESQKLVGLFNGLPKSFSLMFVDDQTYVEVSEYKAGYFDDQNPSTPPGDAVCLTDGRWVLLSQVALGQFKMAQFVDL